MPERISKDEWGRRNPPRPGESFEEYVQRYEDETRPGVVQEAGETVSNLARGGMLGLAKTGTSLVGGAGELFGSPAIRQYAREAERQAQEFYAPEGLAGGIGEFIGRGAGEIATAAVGGLGAAKALTKAAPLVAKAAPRVAKGMTYLGEGVQEGGALRRALSNVAVNAPIDVLQGAAQQDGMMLPGRGGAIAENVFFSGAGGALGGAMAARRAAAAERTKAAADAAEAQAQKVAQELAAAGEGKPRRSTRTAEQALETRRNVPMAEAEAATPEEVAQYLSTRELGGPTPAAARLERARRQVPMAPAEEATPAEVRQYLESRPAGRERQFMENVLESELARNERLARAMQRVQEQKDVAQYGDWVRNIDKMSPAQIAKRLVLDVPGLSEEEALQEAAALISPRTRARRGATDVDLLSTLTGGAAGGLYGAASAEEGESPLARALMYGAGGAVAGRGLSRGFGFFDRGATPSLAPEQAQTLAQQAGRAAREGTPPAKAMGAGLEEFPENREPLFRRLGGEEFAPTERILLEDRIKQVEPTITRPRTEAQLRKEVAAILNESDPNKLLRLNPARATEAESLAIASLYRDIMTRAAQKRELLKTTLDPERLAQLTDDIDAMHETGARFLEKIMKGDTAAGRSLQSRRYVAQDITDPTYWHIKASRIKNVGALTDTERDEVTRLALANNPEKLLQYIASLQKSSKAEQLAQMRSAGLLTAIPGRARDLISTTGNYLSTIIQRYPGTVADIVASHAAARKLGGEAQQFRTMALPSAAEMNASFRGAGLGIRRAAESMGFDAAKEGGMQRWLEYVRQAEIDPEMAKRLEVPSLVNIDLFGKSKAGEVANTVTDALTKSVLRFSGATDKIVREAATSGALYEQATVRAKQLGYKGKEAQDFIQQLVANPTDEMLLDAKAAADVITFTNDGRLSDWISMAIEGAANRAGKKRPEDAALVRAAARFIVPFRRTPANILSTSLRYAPISGQYAAFSAYRDWTKALANAALAGQQVTPEVLKAQRQMVERLTQMGTGLGFFALGAQLYKNNVLTGEFPTNPSEQEQWRLEGKQPESLLLNGQWIPIARISPYGGMLTMAASALQNAKEGGVNEVIEESPLTISRSVLNQPMVTGPKELLDALTKRSQSRAESGGGFIGSMVGSVVPSIVAQAARTEGVQRMPQSLAQQITSRLPGLQETAPARLDIFGQPVEKAGGIANVMLNPLPFTPDRRAKDPLVAEMSRVGVSIGPLGKKSGEPIEMYQWRQREAGKFVRQDLEALVQSPEYQQASATEQRKLIKKTVESARDELSRWVKANYNMEYED